MVERRRSRRLLIFAGIATAVSVALLSAEVLGNDEDSCRTPSAAPRSETALLPAGLSFEEIGTVTGVRKDERYVTVEAYTTKPLEEVAVLMQDAVIDAGYRPAGMESEGVEARVFFTTGPYAAGQARLQRTGCDDGRSDIELVLLDRNAVP